MDEVILDTDMLSEVLKQKNAQVGAAAAKYITEHKKFAFSAMTVYEIVRGLLARNATHQLNAFLGIVAKSDVYPISSDVLLRAAELWAEGSKNGHPHDDADLIIAATALEAGRVLVTGNTSHYQWIGSLPLSNWRQTSP